MGFKTPNFHSIGAFCRFLLAQKVIPAGNRKKGTLPNASSRKASAPLAGQRGQPAFFSISAYYYIFLFIKQLVVLIKSHSWRLIYNDSLGRAGSPVQRGERKPCALKHWTG
jgi:hypothetical protein